MPAARVVICFLATLSTLVALPSRAQVTPTDLAKQDSPITKAPSAITFPLWRNTRNTDFTEEYQLSFPSAVVSQYPENNDVRVTAVLPRNRIGRVPVVLLLHFWGATDNVLEQETASTLANLGIASVYIPLPYHLSRTPAGFRSGELAIQPDPASLRQTMLQSVLDVRRTVDWITTRPEFDSSRIGLTGTSLGAIVSSLAYAVDNRFTCAAFVLGGVDLAHIIWNSSVVVAQRDQLRRKGFTESSLREALKDVEPLTYLANPETRPTYVVRARYDKVVPPESTQELVDRLQTPKQLVIDTGHYGGVLVRGRLLRSVASFFQSEFEGRDFTSPGNFYSPTIRLGLMLEPETGLNVGASLDVWRLNSSNNIFGSVYMTPRGPRGFLGGSIGKGVAIGVIVMPQKTTFGMVWNTVF